MAVDVKGIAKKVEAASGFVKPFFDEVGRVIVGQEYLVERLMMAMLCGGHALLEGVPGLAKTLSVRTAASALDVKFQRIQFTPDLLPADLIGTLVYSPKSGEFSPHLGPVFTNILLADEINRAPAKVQSALLEAMHCCRRSSHATPARCAPWCGASSTPCGCATRESRPSPAT